MQDEEWDLQKVQGVIEWLFSQMMLGNSILMNYESFIKTSSLVRFDNLHWII